MNRSYSGAAIFGGAIVLIGVLLLVRNIFNIHIPVFTLLASLGLIWLGILMIRGNIQGKHNGERILFNESRLNYTPGQDSYSVLFGSGTLNLQDVKPDKPLHLNLELTFGEFKVVTNREVNLQVEGNVSFGKISGPDLRTATFGNYLYTSPGYNPSLPGITIHTRVTFGEMRIFYL
jgi:hypothetical protein